MSPVSTAVLAILALQRVKGIGPASIRKIVPSLGPGPPTAEALQAWVEVLRGMGSRADPIALHHAQELIEYASEVTKRCRELGHAILGPHEMPSLLTDIPNAPVLVFAQGNLGLLAKPCAAVVGTRAATPPGDRFARQVATLLVKRGWVVVSGLAKGIDAAAHQAALAAGGLTIAVLGHGLDEIYPKENAGLADEISKKGLLLSEYPPGQRVANHQLVQRDRIQSGLSRLVVAVETDAEGGTMHTVRFAKAQARTIAAWAPRESNIPSGNAMAISDFGATALETPGQVLEILDKLQTQPSKPHQGRLF